LWVVEDAAEAHRALYKGRVVGGLSQVATFSFYGNKILTSGEGGALTVNDPQLEKRLRTLRGQGVDPQRRYYFPVTGYNFRITNVACALLCGQLERCDEILARRNAIYARYDALLQGTPGIGLQPVAEWADRAPWLYSITVDEDAYGRSRDELMAMLAENKVDTRPFFLALHRLPPFREESRRRREELPITDGLSATGMNLPTYSALTETDQERIAAVIRGGHR